MLRCIPLAVLCLALAMFPPPAVPRLAAGGPGAVRPVVVAADYDSFWLWGGVAPSFAPAAARMVYVLQGKVHLDRRRGAVEVIAQGPEALPRLGSTEAWLVYRSNTLNWPEPVYGILAAQIARWRAAGNRVAGVQVDFDSATPRLGAYADSLRALRRRLPADCRLSITGLLDWGRNAEPEVLDQLAAVVDEVVIQTYQGRRTIPRYLDYLSRTDRLKLPFKVGLLEGGAWLEPADLAANPWFRGYVVFLQGGSRGRG